MDCVEDIMEAVDVDGDGDISRVQTNLKLVLGCIKNFMFFGTKIFYF